MKRYTADDMRFYSAWAKRRILFEQITDALICLVAWMCIAMLAIVALHAN